MYSLWQQWNTLRWPVAFKLSTALLSNFCWPPFITRCVALRYVSLRCVALRCVGLRCVALRCVALRCVALRWVVAGRVAKIQPVYSLYPFHLCGWLRGAVRLNARVQIKSNAAGFLRLGAQRKMISYAGLSRFYWWYWSHKCQQLKFLSRHA